MTSTNSKEPNLCYVYPQTASSNFTHVPKTASFTYPLAHLIQNNAYDPYGVNVPLKHLILKSPNFKPYDPLTQQLNPAYLNINKQDTCTSQGESSNGKKAFYI